MVKERQQRPMLTADTGVGGREEDIPLGMVAYKKRTEEETPQG